MKMRLNYPIRAFAMLLLLSSSSVFAQSKKVTMKQNNLALADAFKIIEKQADVTVAYNSSQIKTNKKVNINVEDQPLEQVLASLLDDTGFSYKVEGNYVVIVKDEKESAVQQQSNQRTGTVTDELDDPLIGVSVVIKGTTKGTITDINGNFALDTPDNATLVFSFVGFKPFEQPVGGKSSFTIRLKEDLNQLDEVIVIGYNTVKLGQVTGALKIVDGKEIQDQSSPTLENRLQGKIAGVMISSGSGQPGSDNLSIRIRGTGSIKGSNTPLYIMDGVMVEPGQFASLNSNDIEDIQVLKDASSTAIYGSRGANGVVVITTKTGKAGKTNVTYKNQFGFSVMTDYLDMMTGEQNIQYQKQAYESDKSRNDFPLMSLFRKQEAGTITQAELDRLAKAQTVNTDWIDLMTRTGFLMDHNVSISGGGDKTKFFVSGSFLKQEGVLNATDLKRYSARFNIDHKVSKYVDFGLKGTIGFSEINFSDPEGSVDNRISWKNPWFTGLLAYPYESPDSWYNGDNPTLMTKYLSPKSKRLKGVWSTYMKVNILDWLSAKTNLGMDYMNNRNTETLHRDHPKASGDKGYFAQNNKEWKRYTWTNTLNAAKDFSNGHSISAVIGMEMFQGQYYTSGFTGYDMDPYMMNSPAGIGDMNGSSDNPPNIRGSKTKNNLMSYFTQVGYAIDSKYNFSGSLRHDTSSKFAKGNRSAMFWSLGASWTLSNEDFLKERSFVDYLRVRASYGTNGNQDGADVRDYSSFDEYTSQYSNGVPGSYNGNSGYIHNTPGNPNLKWETSGQADVGLDFRTWSNRINFTIDLYHKRTKDLFMYKKLSATSGFEGITTNAGTVVNQGIEMSLDVDVLRLKDFTWNVGGNITLNKNKLTDLGAWSNENGYFQDGDILYREGKPLGTWSMSEWAGVDPDTGLVQFYDTDGNKTTKISDAPKVANFKSYEVPVFGGFNTSATYKGFTLSADFTFACNYYIMNASKWYLNNHHFNGNKPAYMLNMWMKPGDITDIPRFGQNTQPSPWASQFLEDASYIRFKTLRLNYQLPQGFLQKTKVLSRASIYAQAENLHTWTDYTGADPEVNGSTDRMSFPKPRNYTFGIEISF